MELAMTGAILITALATLDYLVRSRGEQDFQQWELGDSCTRHRQQQYKRNFGIADVRTLRRMK